MLILPPPYDHCVYLATRRDHVVIYVGVTSNLFARLGNHDRKSSWWSETASIQVESFESRKVADLREQQLIATLEPFYNVAGSECGTTRHLSELRLATQAIRRARTMPIAHPQSPTYENAPTCEPSARGVTLREALPHLALLGNRTLSLEGLRTSAKRDPEFPAPNGQRGVAAVYDLEALKEWRQRRPGHRVVQMS